MTARLIALALLAALAAPLAAQSYDEMLGRTDTSNPDELYDLAMWCKDQRMHLRARQHLRQAIEIDPDHGPSRQEMGYLWYNGEWVHQSRIPGAVVAQKQQEQKQARSGGGTGIGASGPGPKASEIDWNLAIPGKGDEAQMQWLAGIAADMNRASNYSGEMERAWRTFLMDQYLPSLVPALATAMKDPGFKDLYGPSMICMELLKTGEPEKVEMARALLPFLATVSERVSDAEDLYFFGLVAGQLGDKRVVPRLIEMLKSGDDDIVAGAKAGLTAITLQPEHEITAASAQQWWDKYHAASDSLIFGSLLNDSDPMVRLEACKRLYYEQDKRIMPVLFELLANDQPNVFLEASSLLKRVTGSDWDINQVDMPAQEKQERIARLEKWWEEEKGRFTFVEFQDMMNSGGGALAVQRDPVEEWIGNLGSLDGAEARTAYENLRGRGEEAIPALIEGLGNANPLIGNKCRDLLREITGQNFGYDAALGTDAEQQKIIDRWREWAAGAGHLSQP